ncbi:inositol monophosphatase [Prolixibacteraceae bacterium JC049]|nr:inositol monophosphatase [Prolixibacteraceae bacterium JC049]
MNYKEICFQAIEIVEKTGAFIANERKNFSMSAVEHKGKADLVSYVDKTAERKLIDGLEQLILESGFIAEEGTETKKGEQFNWIIDPLDGTTNFVHGVPPYAISVALTEGDEVVIGIVYEITLDECFFSWKGAPAYLNGQVINVSKAKTHSEALVATGFPYTNFSQMDAYIELMREVMESTQGIRRLGSAATDLAYVAAGRYDAFWEYGLNAWDVAAGAFLVQQAGGKVSDFNGGGNYIFGREMVASNENYFNDFYQMVNQYLGEK